MSVAIIVGIAVIALLGLLFVFKKKDAGSKKTSPVQRIADTSIAASDAAYLAMNLTPESSHLDILFYIATTPENIDYATQSYEKAQALKQERIELLKKEEEGKEKKLDAFASMGDDDDGWADEGEGEGDDAADALAAAKKAEAEKERMRKQLAEATGKVSVAEKIKIEGVDEGVLGQNWVEATLGTCQQWPPALNDKIASQKFPIKDDKGNVTKVVPPLEHPGIRRNLCMTAGRLNSTFLNTHKDLVTAGSKGNIDATYFKSGMEYRQRTGLLLEAALRVAMSARSYRLAKTIIETVAMFKVGTLDHDSEKSKKYFHQLMMTQYGGVAGIPKLEIGEKTIDTPNENEIVTEDKCCLTIEIDRPHAESFTRQKLAACMKQGIPPEVGLSTYREAWWIIVRSKRLSGIDGSTDDNDTQIKELLNESNQVIEDNQLFKELDDSVAMRFKTESLDDRLTLAWPFMIANVSQKSGKVKLRFQAPKVPGKYRFLVSIKSQEFIDADHEFAIDADVFDKNAVKRAPKEEKEEEKKSIKEDEPKKTE